MLLHCPCSSACVERLFSLHARIHTKTRSNAKEDTVLHQMKLNSYLRAEKQPESIHSVEDLDHSKLACLIDRAAKCFRAVKAADLDVGSEVLVFYENSTHTRTRRGAKPLEFHCKLLSQNDDGSWRVHWRLDRKSSEPFYPLEDSWVRND